MLTAMAHLPDDVLILILRKSLAVTRVRCERVCRRWSQIANSCHVWKDENCVRYKYVSNAVWPYCENVDFDYVHGKFLGICKRAGCNVKAMFIRFVSVHLVHELLEVSDDFRMSQVVCFEQYNVH